MGPQVRCLLTSYVLQVWAQDVCQGSMKLTGNSRLGVGWMRISWQVPCWQLEMLRDLERGPVAFIPRSGVRKLGVLGHRTAAYSVVALLRADVLILFSSKLRIFTFPHDV